MAAILQGRLATWLWVAPFDDVDDAAASGFVP